VLLREEYRLPVTSVCYRETLFTIAFLSSIKDHFTQRVSPMELALVIFSAVSAISTASLAFILFQIQKSLKISAKKRTESDADIYKQLERLEQGNQSIEQKLVWLIDAQNKSIDAQSKSIDKVYVLLRGNGDLQVNKLQLIEQKLVELIDAQSKSIDKVYELLRGSGDLQINRLQVIIDTLEILGKNIASLHELLKGSRDLQVGKLQTIADNLEALKNSLEESVRF